jgi:hypothetical protein
LNPSCALVCFVRSRGRRSPRSPMINAASSGSGRSPVRLERRVRHRLRRRGRRPRRPQDRARSSLRNQLRVPSSDALRDAQPIETLRGSGSRSCGSPPAMVAKTSRR